jgi:uncharacterized pyridoxamine 5'-phosphate oxidase family protein
MKNLSDEIINFFYSQGFVIVSTIDKNGRPHNSCKGIVRIEKTGKIYLLDLYKGVTFQNLITNSNISITSVDEHQFRGYCIKGKAKKVQTRNLGSQILKAWEDKITSRATTRVVRNIRGEKGYPNHPEVSLPKPEYLIVFQAEEIVNLTPGKLR